LLSQKKAAIKAFMFYQKFTEKKQSKEEDDEKKIIFQDNIIQLTHFILLKKI
jgi:hypothetical protein